MTNPIDLDSNVKYLEYSADGARVLVVTETSVAVLDASNLATIGRRFQPTGSVREAHFALEDQKVLVVSGRTPRKLSNSDGEPSEDDAGLHAWLIDAPEGTPSDAARLADLAEILGGYRVNALGALEPVIGSHLEEFAAREKRSPNGAAYRIASWILSDPARRAVSPFAAFGGGSRTHVSPVAKEASLR